MKITLDIPNDVAPEIIDAFCWAYQYQAEFYDLLAGVKTPNPQTKPQFAKQRLTDHIKEVLKAYRANKGMEVGEASINRAEPDVTAT